MLLELYVRTSDPADKYNIEAQALIGKGYACWYKRKEYLIHFRSVGEVFYATCQGQQVAIKKLQIVRRGRDRRALILREVDLIARSAHDNIVRYVDCYEVGEELWVCPCICLVRSFR